MMLMTPVTVMVTCPRCRRVGTLYRYDDTEPRPGKRFAAYVLHEEPRRTCLLRRVDLEKGVSKCI